MSTNQNDSEARSCCCNAGQSEEKIIPKPIATPALEPSMCCCAVRTSAEDDPLNKAELSVREKFHSAYTSTTGRLIVAVISGAALLASLFCKEILPFDPAWIAIILSGTPLFIEAFHSIRNRKIGAEVLVSTAIIATIITEEYLAGGEVAFIMSLGHLLENWTIRRARAGMEKLIKLRPQTARLVDGDTETMIDAKNVQVGNVIRVLPGESIPVDGVIITGNTSIDQQVLTGESIPVDKGADDEVFAATVNRFGAFTMKATKVGEDSSIAKMIRLVRVAEAQKAPIERITDKAASILVPVAILTAILVGLFTHDVMRGVTILVVFCPCSLVLATPTAIIAAIGNAARYGILIRSGEVLEQLGKVKVIAFDKTGTLTLGQPVLQTAQPVADSLDVDSLLTLAASLEQSSDHPLSRCVVKAANVKQLKLTPCEESQIVPGRGVVGKIDSQTSLLVGNEKMMNENGVVIRPENLSEAEKHTDRGETVVWVAKNGELVGFLTISDTVRKSASGTISQLLNENIDVMLLTGDNSRAANSIAGGVGITKIYSELLPEDKQRIISESQRSGKPVAMIGDGINDAPALKTANVGIAMGKIGSDLAIEAADIALVGDDVSRVPFLVRLSKKTIRTILQNITLSMSINFVAVILAAFGVLNPMLGALVHNLGSLLVVANASLLLSVKFSRTS